MSSSTSIESLVRNVTLSGVVAVAILLCALVVCLLAMVLSLTFDCWWTLGDLCNVGTSELRPSSSSSYQRQRLLGTEQEMEEETHNALENNGRKNRSTRAPPWLLRMKNGKLHNVKAYSYNLDLEMV